MKNILAFGDSLTWGFIAGPLRASSFEVRWPNVLAAALRGKARVIPKATTAAPGCSTIHNLR